jgi:hypothetical protein
MASLTGENSHRCPYLVDDWDALYIASFILFGAAGFDMIEVPLLDPTSVDSVMTKAVLEEYDMQVSSSLVRSYLAAFFSCCF